MVSTRSVDTDRSLFVVRQGVRVRRSTVYRLTYELVVIADDVDDLVRAAGSWLCDRVRAGWQVNVVVPEGADLRSLQILGITSFSVDDPYEVLRGSSPAAVAMAADAVAEDSRIGQFVARASERKIIEITLWGGPAPAQIARHFESVAHSASDVARAFKAHALAATRFGCSDPSSVEEFSSVALWYPLDGADLVPVS